MHLIHRTLLAFALLVALCVTPAATSQAQGLDITSANIVDLTHPLDADTIYWPTDTEGFKLTPIFKGKTEGPEGFFYVAFRFCSPEHGGTHLDAPYHFAEGRKTTAEIPVQRLIGPAIVVDISAKAAKDRDYVLSVEDVSAWEAEHGKVPSGAIVLLRTGWSKRWPNKLAYLGDDTPGDASNLHFPSYGPAAARMLVDRGAMVLGVDTASIDNGPSRKFYVHRIAGAANVAGLENLTNLDKLPPTGAWVATLPMKIAGGSGAPARVVAFLPGPAKSP
jgi:kynurenine formamidase